MKKNDNANKYEYLKLETADEANLVSTTCVKSIT